jgi:hypothetical protein
MTRALAKALYVLLGAVFLAAGVSVLLLGTGLLPGPVRDLIEDVGGGTRTPCTSCRSSARSWSSPA